MDVTLLDGLRCPFAERGISSDAIAACPGYAATPLVFNLGIGESIPAGETCAHIEPLPTARGFMAGCTHPSAWLVIRLAETAVAQATDAHHAACAAAVSGRHLLPLAVE